MEEDTVSLPHQQSFSSLKTDSDYIYQVHTPCYHAPFFHSQRIVKSSPCKVSDTKLGGTSVPKNIVFREYSAAETVDEITTVITIEKYKNQEEAASVSNPLLSPSSSSKFVHKPKKNSSKAKLFVLDKTSSNSSISTTIEKKSAGNLSGVTKENLIQSNPPKLESNLQNILNSGSFTEKIDKSLPEQCKFSKDV